MKIALALVLAAVAAAAGAAAFLYPVVRPGYQAAVFEDKTIRLALPEGWIVSGFNEKPGSPERALSIKNYDWIKDSRGVGTDRKRPGPFDTKWDRFVDVYVREYTDRRFKEPKQVYEHQVKRAMSTDGLKALDAPPPIRELKLADGTAAIAYPMPKAAREADILTEENTGFWRSTYERFMVSRPFKQRVVFLGKNGLVYEVRHDVDKDGLVRRRYARVLDALIQSIQIK